MPVNSYQVKRLVRILKLLFVIFSILEGFLHTICLRVRIPVRHKVEKCPFKANTIFRVLIHKNSVIISIIAFA